MEDQIPAFENPPPTDVGGMPQFWSSFNIVPKRVQEGGWARQVTTADFPISTDIAGVNMRLGPEAFANCTGTSRRNGRS